MLLKLQDFLLFDQSNVQREIKEIQFGKLGSFLCELTELSEEENRHAKSCRLCSLDSMSSVRGLFGQNHERKGEKAGLGKGRKLIPCRSDKASRNPTGMNL